MKRILAAVDFSDWTAPVLQMAVELAGKYGGKVTVAYADRFLPPPYFTERAIPQVNEALEAQREGARKYLDLTAEKEIQGRVPFDTSLIESAPAPGIVTAAENAQADLIVMGTHGRGGLDRLLMGSVAEKVVRESRVPVLTVRGIGDEAAGCRLPIRKILCPINFTDVAREALHYAGDLAQRFDAELVVVTSLENNGDASDEAVREQEQKLCTWVPDGVQAHCTVEPIVRRGDAAEQILRTAREVGSDLVVIGAQHRPFLEATILGTTSIRVLRHAACPVLTVVRH